ncbi:MAG TPA: helix-turn-helix domain-containing protein [Noviherbaspirillum sp.]|jgi:AraC family transcriptional activator of pobA|uniref:helix-turn-helix domain-containing protein n=1 Tax=Noviherbaspirillum sp. TaxID=1926288 RepID=UPI002F94D434
MVPATAVPVYKLYGEQDAWLRPDMVHCESIASRSSLHDWHIKPHCHVGLFQLLYLERGNARVQLDDAHFAMTAGQVLAVPQSCIHGFHFQQDALGCVITIAYPLASRLLRDIDGGLLPLPAPRLHTLSDDAEGTHLHMLFEAFMREYASRAPFRHALMETLLAALLIALSRHLAPRPEVHAGSTAGRHFARFCELVDAWYGQHHPVSRYARELGISAAHLNLLCRRAAGRSALDLIHDRLLLEAKRRLVYTSMNIAEVSYAIGFSDPGYFTRFFKRRVGQGPKDFRRQAEQDNAVR